MASGVPKRSGTEDHQTTHLVGQGLKARWILFSFHLGDHNEGLEIKIRQS